ncbi:putative DNA-binding protein [Acidisarcina polymorpha]|uniref:Putative DNA-binding protein n=1 Tax=Acidisarcina polymorpha TaxID=2211140 RepID=A0A2Z5GAY2_9BACT|nr:helix-turn-helix transcriptional regulator [Acidisarcina polymorpha]AXC15776.1 putative DNA-binding protein [Acidisarcina polymorpha]
MSARLDTYDGALPTAARNELGDFLRSRRAKLSAEALGLSKQRRRRTPGLRREEVAERAGIGVDWYIRLEQGRTVSPSSATVDALAKALCLSKVEHSHLRALATTSHRAAFCRETVPDELRRMIEGLNNPAYIAGRRWDVLAWNDAAADLFPDLTRVSQEECNCLILIFESPLMKNLYGRSWEVHAKHMLSSFRATYDFWADDPAFIELRERLRRACPDFESWWESHEVTNAFGLRKELHHPRRGLIGFDIVSFQANDDPSLKLVMYTPLAQRITPPM